MSLSKRIVKYYAALEKNEVVPTRQDSRSQLLLKQSPF